MNFSRPPEMVLREFEIRNLVLGGALLLAVALVFRDLEAVWSCFLGVVVSLVHFQFLKRDGREIAAKAKAGLPYNRILLAFLTKFYLRLLATGFLLGLLFMKGWAKPLYLTVGLSVIVLQGFFLVLEMLLAKSWSLIALRR